MEYVVDSCQDTDTVWDDSYESDDGIPYGIVDPRKKFGGRKSRVPKDADDDGTVEEYGIIPL